MEQTIPPAPPPPTPRAPAHPLHAATGGLARAIGFGAGVLLLGLVFVIGLVFGAFVMFAGSMADTPVYHQTYREGGRSKVAIIPVEGVIDPYRADAVRYLVDSVLDDSSIRAVVLRVDSPGGGIAPSDQIWYQVNRVKDAGLPVIASYGGVAASGGYYVSCAADHIVAEPTCITGSIGVIAQTFIFTGLMDKIGVEPVTLLSSDSPQKDIGNPFRAWTEEDRQEYVRMLDAAYEIFNQRVRDGRQDVIGDAERVDALADGSIYTAKQAAEVGLVDSIGYLDDAVALAEAQAGMRAGSSTVLIMREPTSLFSELFGVEGRARTTLGNPERVRSMLNDLGRARLMYLMR